LACPPRGSIGLSLLLNIGANDGACVATLETRRFKGIYTSHRRDRMDQPAFPCLSPPSRALLQHAALCPVSARSVPLQHHIFCVERPICRYMPAGHRHYLSSPAHSSDFGAGKRVKVLDIHGRDQDASPVRFYALDSLVSSLSSTRHPCFNIVFP
jgi:hypothetical protein